MNGGKSIDELIAERVKNATELIKKIYERIWEWHKTYGIKKAREYFSERHVFYLDEYLKFRKALPLPNKALLEDIGFVCDKFHGGCMEWSVYEKDEHGIALTAYTDFAYLLSDSESMKKFCAVDDTDLKRFRKPKDSKLYAKFGS